MTTVYLCLGIVASTAAIAVLAWEYIAEPLLARRRNQDGSFLASWRLTAGIVVFAFVVCGYENGGWTRLAAQALAMALGLTAVAFLVALSVARHRNPDLDSIDAFEDFREALR